MRLRLRLSRPPPFWRRSASALARASRSALKLRLCGFFGVTGASLASAFTVSLAGAGLDVVAFSAFGVTFSFLGVGATFGAGLLSALAVPPFKLEVIRLASASSTDEEWLLTESPSSCAFATTTLLSTPTSFAISYNRFFDT